MDNEEPVAGAWRVEVNHGEWRSVCGPDYERESEFHVVEVATGRVVMTFTESGDWPYMVVAKFSGTASVEIAPDGRHVVVTDHDGSVRTLELA